MRWKSSGIEVGERRAEYRDRRCIDELRPIAVAGRAHRLQQGARAVEIDPIALVEIELGLARDHAGEVEDHIGTRRRPPCSPRPWLRGRRSTHSTSPEKPAGAAGAHDVEQGQLVDRLAIERAVAGEPPGELAADHAGGAGDEDMHVASSLPKCRGCRYTTATVIKDEFAGEASVKMFQCLGIALALLLAAPVARADDAAAKNELAPTGKLRVGIAVGAIMGAGNVVMDPASGKPRGIAVDLGTELAQKLGTPIDFVAYPNSGALTNAADSNAWDVAFIPVDDERKKRVDFGAAHIVLQSTYLVAPGSAIRDYADVDRPGVRVVGVENTATARAAAAALKNVTVSHVKTGGELFELLASGKADAIVQSRETLTGLSAQLPGSRVLDGSFLNSFVAIAVPKNRPAALAYVTAFIEDAKASGSVRRALDNAGLKTSVVAPAGVKP